MIPASISTSTVRWTAAGCDVTLGVDEAGRGRSVILLPALSSISTRLEMRPLLECLAAHFHVRSIDWPGFGDLPRPGLKSSPPLLSAFLEWLLRTFGPPHAIVAAGHAATYALHHAVHHPGDIDRLVLIAPTWRGPLPTMIGGQRSWFGVLRAAFDLRGLGALLYGINVSSPVLKAMAREHVYEDPHWLAAQRLASKRAVTRAPGARYGSVRFVTGALDRVDTRAAFLDLAQRAAVPLCLIYGERTPRRSRAEMAALAGLTGVRTQPLAHGKLSVHEEFPEEVCRIATAFLGTEQSDLAQL
jgi:pimeloyl-ACP methyl ester carboxylesterase